MKFILIPSCLALFGTAVLTQSDAPAAIKSHVSILQTAKTFKTDFTVRKLSGGQPEKGTLMYSKTGMFKIETSGKLTVSDGKMVWVLNKEKNTYTEAPASLARTKEGDVWAWAGFFNEDPFKGVKDFQSMGSKTIQGASLSVYAAKLPGDKLVTLYLDPKSGVAKGYSNTEVLVMGGEMTLGKEPGDAKDFAFTAPAGAKKEEVKPESSLTFADIEPILKASCSGCHNSGNPKSGLAVDSYAGVMKKVTAGDASSSSLYRVISGPRPSMPKGGAPLPKESVEKIQGWINGGAKN